MILEVRKDLTDSVSTKVSQKGLRFMQETQATQTSNILYDLVSTLYHELETEQTCEAYILDSDQEGKPEVTSFFHDVQQDAHKHAERAKQLLGISSK